MDEPITDHNDQPLPAQYQRDSPIYRAVYRGLDSPCVEDPQSTHDLVARVLVELWEAQQLEAAEHPLIAVDLTHLANLTDRRQQVLQAWFDQIQASERSCACTPRLSGGRRTLFTHQVDCPVYAALWAAPAFQSGPKAP